MKEILCYGDSNTWGFTPGTGARYPYAVRWPGALGALLGSGCRITENGVNGRTTVFNDPDFPCRNGKTGLGYALCAGKPFDLVILMLGTNDLKFTDAAGAARGAAELVALLQNANARFPGATAVFPQGAKILLGFAVAHRRKCCIRGTLFQPGPNRCALRRSTGPQRRKRGYPFSTRHAARSLLLWRAPICCRKAMQRLRGRWRKRCGRFFPKWAHNPENKPPVAL